MTTNKIKIYYDETTDRAVREDLRYAVSLVQGLRVAIDCGCGAGSDIAYLRSQGFTVHGFDVEPESIARCHQRFENDSDVHLSQQSFISFTYPSASLICADASLFFCPPKQFHSVWHKITGALIPTGVFSGSFLGPRDTMASPDYDKEALWPEVLVMREEEIRPLFEGFEIVKWTEHELSGQTAQSEPHRWHIFSVVARKHPHQ